MEITVERDLLQKCLRQVENQVGWGSSHSWNNQDFETLSEKIQEATGTYLSVTTLKRIWGKVRYDSSPTTTTLNALAQFIRFENWRAFTQSVSNSNENAGEPSEEIIVQPEKISTVKKLIVPLVISAIIIAGVFAFYLFSSEKTISPAPVRVLPRKIDTSQFSFTSRKIVSTGIPNSVVFDYDASAAASLDTIFIQQSWDRHLTQQVSRDGHEHTSIYYYPGFFLARLVVNDEVVKYHPLFIQTNGWLPLVEQNPVPVYFSEADAKQRGMMSLSPGELKEKNISLQPQTPWIDYYNVRNFGDLQTDNFVFNTEVKNDYHEGSGICENTEIKILSEGSALIIPLSIQGCISGLKLYLLDHEADGKKEDLSAFGCDLSSWVNVRCEVAGNHLRIYVNDRQAYEAILTAPAAKITGIVFRFQGGGSVRSVSLGKSNGETVYADHF